MFRHKDSFEPPKLQFSSPFVHRSQGLERVSLMHQTFIVFDALFSRAKPEMPSPDDALPGREKSVAVASAHAVLGTPMVGPFEGKESFLVGMGCFWGAERKFWTQEDNTFYNLAQFGPGSGHLWPAHRLELEQSSSQYFGILDSRNVL